jgi:plastocyanin
MMSSTIRRVVALGAVALFAAGCAGSDGEEGVTGGPDATGGANAADEGGYYGGRMTETEAADETGSTGDAGTGEASLSVALNNYLFDPARIEVESGATIELKNANANTPHTFTVKGTNIDVSLEPLTSDTAVVDLEPGAYGVFCRLHTSFDMEAELTVT